MLAQQELEVAHARTRAVEDAFIREKQALLDRCHRAETEASDAELVKGAPSPQELGAQTRW